jgi:hypothetical protein
VSPFLQSESSIPMPKPKDVYRQSLSEKYRQLLFRLVRSNPRYPEEYLKPIPPGETWLGVQEQSCRIRIKAEDRALSGGKSVARLDLEGFRQTARGERRVS